MTARGKLTEAQRAYIAKHDGDKPLSEHDGGYRPYRFICRLEDLGMVDVDRRGRISGFNSTTLTPAGRAALNEVRK